MTRFVHEVHMRWSDMDAYRHINNSAYLAYLEQARVAMFFHRFEGFSSGTVIARHEIDYLHPVVYHPEPLRLELWIDTIRGASFVVHYEVIDPVPGGGRVAVRAATTCVTVDFEAEAPRRLSAEEREILRGFADEPDTGAKLVDSAPPSEPGTPSESAAPLDPAAPPKSAAS